MILMTVLAVILARGGSKGIPRKNLRKLSGTPIVEWCIRSAKASKRIDGVLLSSDDDEILQLGIRLGCDIHERNHKDALDTTSSEQSLLAAINESNEASGASVFVLIQPTSPLTLPQDFDSAIETYFERKLDSLVSVVPNHTFLWELREGGHSIPNYDPENRPRRQEIEGQFAENGAFYITSRELLEGRNCRLGGRIGMHVMEPHHSVEIDDEIDFIILEELVKILKLAPVSFE